MILDIGGEGVGGMVEGSWVMIKCREAYESLSCKFVSLLNCEAVGFCEGVCCCVL